MRQAGEAMPRPYEEGEIVRTVLNPPSILGTQIALTALAGRHSIGRKREAWLVGPSFREGNTHEPQHQPAQHHPPPLRAGLRGRHLRFSSADTRLLRSQE